MLLQGFVADEAGGLDLPHDTPSDIYRSPLIHADVLACLSSADRKDFTSLRRDLKQAIRDGASISRRIGFKVPQMYRLKEFTIHLSPLKVRCELE